MSFLQQNKFSSRRKSYIPKSFLVIVGLVLVIVVINYLTFGAISTTLHSIGEPVWKSQAGIARAIENIFTGFKDKQKLQYENDILRGEVIKLKLASIPIEILRQENKDLRNLLNREDSSEFIATAVLARPNRTLYDTLIVDVGRRDGVTKDNRVFGAEGVVIGLVEEVYPRTSLISLYSTPGRSMEVLLGTDFVAAEAIGRGGGDFEVRIPRGVEVLEGHAVFSPGLGGDVLGIIEEIIALPADSFQTILFSSPINIQSIRIVAIELQ